MKRLAGMFLGTVIGGFINALVFSSIIYVLKGVHVWGIHEFSFWKGTLYFAIVLMIIAIINTVLLLVKNRTVYISLTIVVTPIVMSFVDVQHIEFHVMFVIITGVIISLRYLKHWMRVYLRFVEKYSNNVINHLLS